MKETQTTSFIFQVPQWQPRAESMANVSEGETQREENIRGDEWWELWMLFYAYWWPEKGSAEMKSIWEDHLQKEMFLNVEKCILLYWLAYKKYLIIYRKIRSILLKLLFIYARLNYCIHSIYYICIIQAIQASRLLL